MLHNHTELEKYVPSPCTVSAGQAAGQHSSESYVKHGIEMMSRRRSETESEAQLNR